MSKPMARAVGPQWAQKAGRQVSDSHILPNTSGTLYSIYNVRSLDKTDFKKFSSHKILLSVWMKRTKLNLPNRQEVQEDVPSRAQND